MPSDLLEIPTVDMPGTGEMIARFSIYFDRDDSDLWPRLVQLAQLFAGATGLDSDQIAGIIPQILAVRYLTGRSLGEIEDIWQKVAAAILNGNNRMIEEILVGNRLMLEPIIATH